LAKSIATFALIDTPTPSGVGARRRAREEFAA
jgi:hypothetical protein